MRDLLSHTSGYQDYWQQDYVLPLMMQPVSSEKILDMWAKSHSISNILCQPRTKISEIATLSSAIS